MLVHGMKILNTLRGLMNLTLEMGHTIRLLDENNEHLEQWTNDGEYIACDGRWDAAKRYRDDVKELVATIISAMMDRIDTLEREDIATERGRSWVHGCIETAGTTLAFLFAPSDGLGIGDTIECIGLEKLANELLEHKLKSKEYFEPEKGVDAAAALFMQKLYDETDLVPLSGETVKQDQISPEQDKAEEQLCVWTKVLANMGVSRDTIIGQVDLALQEAEEQHGS